MTGGSQQLRIYRRARRDGHDIETAARMAAISVGEAELIDKDDAREPPPPESFELIYQTPAGAVPVDKDGEQIAATGGHLQKPALAGLASTTLEVNMPKHDDIAPTPDNEDPLIELAAETLRGDMRDSLLAWFKSQPKSWPFMSEREQRDLADAADRYARSVIKQACQIIAAGERPTIVAKLVEYKEKDGVEAKLKLPSTGETVGALHEACGREVLLVTAGAEDFMEQAGDAEIDADQPKFPNIGEDYDDAA